MAKQTLEPGDVGFEEIDFITTRKVDASDYEYVDEDFFNALACGSTEEGEESCAYVEDVDNPHIQAHIKPKWWGFRILGDLVDVSRTTDEEDYMSGDAFDVGF